jgi:thymidine kinase
MLPPHFPFPKDPKRRAEADVFAQFATLEDKWTVIYSLTWHGERNRRTGDGEADFILLHPNYGFFVAEVKGGEKVFLRDGRWFSKPHGKTETVEIRDPFEQALASSKSIDSWLSKNGPSVELPSFGHFVVFPGFMQSSDISPAGRREIIMDKADLATPLASLQRISNHWNRKMTLSPRDVDAVVNALRPNIEFELDRRIELEHAQLGIKELTQQQLTVLAAIRRQNRLLVHGTAGTGKTVLAVESAKHQAQSGKRTLLLCFNRPLGENLQKLLVGTPNLTVGSFHSFAKQQVDFSSLSYDDFDDIPYLLSEAASLNKTTFDAFIIDEAQDFKADWWDALQYLASDLKNAVFHVFQDVNQDIYEGESTEFLEQFAPVDLTINCRNTLPIATLVHSLGHVSTVPRSTDGPLPIFQVVGSRSGVERRLVETIEKWTKTAGLLPPDITVLTDTGELADRWYGNPVGSFAFGDGTKGTIKVDTIQRFKGLESEALLCIFDPEIEYEAADRSVERLGYVGFSRAKTLLTVLASEPTLNRLRR